VIKARQYLKRVKHGSFVASRGGPRLASECLARLPLATPAVGLQRLGLWGCLNVKRLLSPKKALSQSYYCVYFLILCLGMYPDLDLILRRAIEFNVTCHSHNVSRRCRLLRLHYRTHALAVNNWRYQCKKGSILFAEKREHLSAHWKNWRKKIAKLFARYYT
jgi:hypothetical protein